MNYATFETALEDNILTLTLNRPDRLNAFNTDMQIELTELFRDVNDDEVRAAIVTGAGRGFCAGRSL